jgi:hypothetical protein
MAKIPAGLQAKRQMDQNRCWPIFSTIIKQLFEWAAGKRWVVPYLLSLEHQFINVRLVEILFVV